MFMRGSLLHGIEDLLHKGQLPSPSYNHDTLKYHIKGMKVFVFVSCMHRRVLLGVQCMLCMESVLCCGWMQCSCTVTCHCKNKLVVLTIEWLP